tara:strand:- start:3159 stop:3659 length:501 start_codon:yes stop_codon:yes gene_type:complete
MAAETPRAPNRTFPPEPKIQYTVSLFLLRRKAMSLGSWDPKVEARSTELLLESDLLHRLIAYSHDEQLAQLEQLLNANDKQRLAGLMKIDPLIWQTAAEPLLENDLLHLIRFFAVAENLPGWEAGATSPVIPLAKILRQRGVRLDKSLLQWLREVNDNRYLPYGPL